MADGQLLEDESYPPLAHLEIIYRELKNRLDVQRTELDELQRIVAIVLTATGVVFGFSGSRFPAYGSGHSAFWLFVVTALVLVIDVGVGVVALWPTNVKTTAEPGPLVSYLGAPSNLLLFDLISAARGAFEENETLGLRRRRSRLVRSQLGLLLLGSALLGSGLAAPHL